MPVKDNLVDLAPATGAYVVVESGVMHLSDWVNIFLLGLIGLQIGYVVWKWRRDWKRHNSGKKNKTCPRKGVEPRREENDV